VRAASSDSGMRPVTITRAPSVGTRLFERDTRGTALTPAGEAFLPEALGVLSAARAAAASARAAAVPERIIVGHVAALLVTPAVRALRAARPHAEVRTLHLGWREPRPALLARRVDVAVARLPFPTEGLRIRPLYDELRVLLVARDHRLAGRSSIRLADIADSGTAVALVTASIRHGQLRPDLTTVPLEDVAPVPVVLAHRADDRRPLIDEFCQIAAARLQPPEPDEQP